MSIDPEESGSWDPLDGELKTKLDQRRYVSLSRDRKGLPEEEESPIPDDVDEEDMSLFDIHMPGVLTVEQVEGLDLDHWLLLVRGTLVHMIVSGPLASTALFANYIMNLGPGPCWLGTNAHPKSSIGERDCFRTCGSSGGELGSRECCSTIRLIQIIHPEKVYACMKILYYRCICTQRQSHQQTNNLYQKKKKKKKCTKLLHQFQRRT